MLRFEQVVPENVELAISVQKELFPMEAGEVDLTEGSQGKCPDHQFKMDYWLAFDGEQVVGMVGLYAYKAYPKDAWLGWYGVRGDFRRKGFGLQIFNFAKEIAKAEGFETLRLYTDEIDNLVATKLYEKVGMTKEIYDNAEDVHFEVGKTLIYSLSLFGKDVEPWNNRDLFLSLHEQRNEEGI